MSNNLLRTAVVIALGAASSSALAFTTTSDPTGYPLGLAGYYEVNLSGATASSTTARNWVIDKICDTTNTVDVYRRWTGAAYGNDWAVGCVVRAHQDADGDAIIDVGETVDTKQVLFRKRDNGGSGWGVTPVTHPTSDGTATGYQVTVMKVGIGVGENCDPAVFANVAGVTSNGRAYTEHRCGTADVNRVPDAGFSDIEPSKFFGINKPPGLPDYTASTNLSINTFGALVFGTPITLDLYKALQAVQFDASSTCNPTNAGWTLAIGDTEACMPSLTSNEIRSLFTGGIKKWDSFMVTNGAGPKIALAAHPLTAAFRPAATNNLVQICRRVNGSGTQAQFNAIFTNWPCDQSVSTASTAPGSTTFGPVVAENNGSGDVGKCLDDFNDASNASGKNGGSIKRWAIGINSTENNVPVGGVYAQNYRFVKIDGFAPTIHSVFNGDYYDYAEQSFQYRENVNTLLNTTVATEKTNTLAILKYLAQQGNTPNDTASVNTAFVYTWGQGGWLVTPKSTGGFSPSNPFLLSNPVNSNTRAPFGKAPNTCHFPTVIKTVLTGS